MKWKPASAEMTGEMRGPLLVGASTTIADFILPPVLAKFNALYPQVRVSLFVANSATIESRVAAHAVDVGLIDAPVGLPALASQIFCEDELVAIFAPDYPLASLKSVTPKVLAEHEFISREPGSGTRSITDAYFSQQKIPPETLKTLMELGSPEALKERGGERTGFRHCFPCRRRKRAATRYTKSHPAQAVAQAQPFPDLSGKPLSVTAKQHLY
jgi:DNA-binding transcriptional LysR family regulator